MGRSVMQSVAMKVGDAAEDDENSEIMSEENRIIDNLPDAPVTSYNQSVTLSIRWGDRCSQREEAS